MLNVPKLVSKKAVDSIAILTSGGDAPGMNAAVRAAVRYGLAHNCKMWGIYKGYSGLLEGQIQPMTSASVANVIQRGGTILKTDRCLSFHKKTTRREAANILTRKGINGLIVIGGDGSFTGAHLMEKETGFKVIGVPGTIDNDINGTEDTIGFDTAVNTAMDAIDRIRDTASSHDRIFIVEVMGHSSGFIALRTGIGAGAEHVVVPEFRQSVEDIVSAIQAGIQRGKTSSIIVVAEGPQPGLSFKIANDLKKNGYESKVCILGHTQRGGSPTGYDRMMASTMGASAVAYLLHGDSNAMVGIQKDNIVLVPFKDVIGKKKPLPIESLALAKVLATGIFKKAD